MGFVAVTTGAVAFEAKLGIVNGYGDAGGAMRLGTLDARATRLRIVVPKAHWAFALGLRIGV